MSEIDQNKFPLYVLLTDLGTYNKRVFRYDLSEFEMPPCGAKFTLPLFNGEAKTCWEFTVAYDTRERRLVGVRDEECKTQISAQTKCAFLLRMGFTELTPQDDSP